jgi:hypothetical protein
MATTLALDLNQLIARYASKIRIYQKAVCFDHEHIACTAYCLVLETPDGLRSASIQAYNGSISEKQAAILEGLEQGNLLAKPEKYLTDLAAKKGYTLATTAKKARARKGGA